MKKVIATTNAPAAIGPYSQAIQTGNMLFISGQIPVNPATGEVPEGIVAQTTQVFANIKAILSEAGVTCWRPRQELCGPYPSGAQSKVGRIRHL